MTCQRCIGLMVPEHVWDWEQARYILMFYCVNCGGVTDRIVARNQAHQRAQGTVLVAR